MATLRAGDYVNATAVFDVDAIGQVRIIAGFNRGVDASGRAMGAGEPGALTDGAVEHLGLDASGD